MRALQTCVHEAQEGLSKAEVALSAELLMLHVMYLPRNEVRLDVRPASAAPATFCLVCMYLLSAAFEREGAYSTLAP